MPNNKSLTERLNTIKDEGPEKWLSRGLFEDAYSKRSNDGERIQRQLPPPEITKELQSSQPSREPARGFNPFMNRAAPDPAKVQRNFGDLSPSQLPAPRNGSNFQNGFAERNEQLNWETETDPQKIRDWGIHALLDARDFAEDQRLGNEVKPSGMHMPLPGFQPAKDRRRLNHQEVKLMERRKDRNLGLYGSFTPEQLKSLDPEVKKQILDRTSQLVKSSRPFDFSPAFVESTYKLLRQALSGKEGFKPSGARNFDPYQNAQLASGTDPDDAEKAGYQGIKVGGNTNLLRKEGDEIFPSFHPLELDPEKHYKNGTGKEKGTRVLNAVGKERQAKFDEYINGLGEESIGKLLRDGGTGEPRAKMAWQLYLMQGGLDALTGAGLDPRSMQLDHVAPFDSNLASRTELPENEVSKLMQAMDLDPEGDHTDNTEYNERYNDRRLELIKNAQTSTDSIDNLVLLNSSTNGAKGDRGMEDLYKHSVDPYVNLSDEDYENKVSDSDEGFERMKGMAGEYDNNRQRLIGQDGILNELARFFIDVDGNFVGENNREDMRGTLPEFMEKFTHARQEMDRVREEIVGKNRNKTEFKRNMVNQKPTKLKAKRDLNDKAKVAEYEKQLTAHNNELLDFDEATAKKINANYTGAGNIQDRLIADILKMTKHNAGFRNRHGGEKFEPEDFLRYFQKMADDKDIGTTNGKHRDMWNHMAGRAQKLAEHTDRLKEGNKPFHHLMNPKGFMSHLLTQADTDYNKYDFGEDDDDFNAASVL